MKYEFKIKTVVGYENDGSLIELEEMLNNGWEVVRADHTGDNIIIVYILKRTIKE